ncbi:DUF2510 domain-containing protein [Rhodococcus sp. IEGM 1330]|uniref:DUF2510 domain-containing protein n=1 Tax=Rhodococcus sp. IEGM 1330 TaxID=3082225 RepID=UPI002954D634|nr:DUF2510 domain-containing protein [Rhodococcus sp. IEGM 1330]MDV8024966.1 DUF2510 domain-containing protein [Rhodococcus sp. IEGM 1330]
MTVAGWYPDPVDHTVDRYWDGAQWTPAIQARRARHPIPAPQPKTKRPNKTLQTLGVIFLVVFFGGMAISAIEDDTTAPVARTPDTAETVAEAQSPEQVMETENVAGPRDTLNYDDGLQAAVTAVVEGPSTSSLDDEGPYTVISYALHNTGTETLDAADWYAPHVNYGPAGVSTPSEILAGTISGIEPAWLKGSGLIAPGGTVTVSFAYKVAAAELSSATITPRWPGRKTWTGDFGAAFG